MFDFDIQVGSTDITDSVEVGFKTTCIKCYDLTICMETGTPDSM